MSERLFAFIALIIGITYLLIIPSTGNAGIDAIIAGIIGCFAAFIINNKYGNS